MTARIIPFPGPAVPVSLTPDEWRVTTPAGRAWLYALRSPVIAQAKALAAALEVRVHGIRP